MKNTIQIKQFEIVCTGQNKQTSSPVCIWMFFMATWKVEQNNKNARGCRRNPADWLDNNVSTPFLIDQGFTGHEHMDKFGLNMFSEHLGYGSGSEPKPLVELIPKAIEMSASGNGRVYDPILGRFLNPDNYVQMPDFTQNFNRYSYVLNNPLKYTDPTGEWVFSALLAVGGAYLGGVSSNNWEMSPLKWDYEDPNTWISMVSTGFLGYKIGSNLEVKYMMYKYRKTVKRMNIAVRDFPVSDDGRLPISNEILERFSEAIFNDYKYRNKGRLLVDTELQLNLKADAAVMKGNGWVDGKMDILFASKTFESKWRLFQAMGHEYVHLANIVELGPNFNNYYSEYAAYSWNMLVGSSDYWKEAYLKETLHDKERKSKWQQQKMVKQAKPAGIDIQQKKVEQVVSANILSNFKAVS